MSFKKLSCVLSLFLFNIQVHAAPMKMPPTMVKAITVKSTQWQPHLDGIGTLTADQGITVKSEITGRISEIYFKSGQEVKKGDKLIQLNPDILKAQLDIALAAHKLDTLEYQRTADLYKKNNVSKSTYDKAKATLQAGLGNVEKAQAQFDQALILAPFSGRLGLRKINVGDYITAGQALVNLQSDERMLIDFDIAEVYVDQLKAGQKIVLTADTHSKQEFSGQVVAVETIIDKTTRNITVRASVANPNHILVPGAFAEVRLFLGEKRPTIIIPKIAVFYADKQAYIYKVKQGKAQKTKISIERALDEEVVIQSGVEIGDVIVLSGQMKLSNGSPVAISQ